MIYLANSTGAIPFLVLPLVAFTPSAYDPGFG
jgi:hypothetical protein